MCDGLLLARSRPIEPEVYAFTEPLHAILHLSSGFLLWARNPRDTTAICDDSSTLCE
jgi:hypothetical protein